MKYNIAFTLELEKRDADNFPSHLASGFADLNIQNIKVSVTNAEISIAASTENNLFAMFNKAKEHLKWPKIVFPSETEGHYTFKFLGEKSTTPGAISITGGQDGKKYYGKLFKDGKVKWFQDAAHPVVQSEINTIISDPTSTAKLLGLQYNHCCFCGLELTNKNSLTVGYGPICAENWGLPWEGTADAAEMEAERKLIEGYGEL